jgi:hypothetical protein
MQSDEPQENEIGEIPAPASPAGVEQVTGSAPPNEESAAKASRVNSGSRAGSEWGCLFYLLIWVVWRVVWHNESWSDAFDYVFGGLWFLVSTVAWPVLFNLAKVAGAGGVAVLILYLISRAAKWLAGKNSDPEMIAGYLNSFLPLKLLLKAPKFFTDSGSMIQEAAAGRQHWSYPPLTLLGTAAGLLALESFLGLPPTNASAARTLYEGAIHQAHDPQGRKQKFLLDGVRDELGKGATDKQRQKLQSNIPKAFRCNWRLGIPDYEELLHGLPGGDDLRLDVRYERATGISFMGFCMEWGLGVRTGRELIRSLPQGSSERDLIQASIDRIEKATTLDKAISDAILVLITVPTAIGLYLGTGRRLRFLRALAVASILWTVLLLTAELVYASTSFVVMLAEAELLGTLAQVITLQIWLLAILPKALQIGRARCWLVGNGAWALLQGLGFVFAMTLF